MNIGLRMLSHDFSRNYFDHPSTPNRPYRPTCIFTDRTTHSSLNITNGSSINVYLKLQVSLTKYSLSNIPFNKCISPHAST